MAELAVTGGQALWSGPWPTWPQQNAATVDNVLRCLQSQRWAISGPREADDGFEYNFAESFARYLDVPWCVPTTNGTSSLVIGLEALDVGAGDEVIVPGITWVASASTVLAVNALPVIVDVDPTTLCIDPAAIRAAISPRTAAVSIVHLYGSVCDLDAIRALCDQHSLALIEDSAQAHGAAWRGRKVGGWGDVGAFSMQQTKLLTAGEGGAAVTRDESLHRRMYQLRSDGRSRVMVPRANEMELSMHGEIMGANYCMPELTAAVLIGQLEGLPAQNDVRRRNANLLDGFLGQIPGVTPTPALEGVTERTYYYYTFRIEREQFGGHTAATVAAALTAETGATFQPTYSPLPRHPLLRPLTKRRFREIPGLDKLTETSVPTAEAVYRDTVTLYHPALLADADRMAVLAEAVDKVRRHPHELNGFADGDLDNPL